ncbi:GIY-YIG nuclease family protein [Rhodopirellula europaea]|uniref:Methionine sulfoxide reductase A n=1 Tax=Rhodopirellula europaea 6C TaxID=1263867 RepID=M2AUI8_9BACT|nr:GIY-YIG nuclease family protein [Rhodopirellula europaea]EMB13674.1 methionine sulfoxide reductase A [Rhodopirellula europaea 6C]
MNGRSIRIYLVDGDASGLLTAEVMNWSGKMLVSPRSRLADLAKREEITRTGIYILAGADPENPIGEVVYVGEGDNVIKRLASHDKDEKKDFWTRCVAVISKDLNLTKAHVRYLESRLISAGYAAGRAKIHNGTAPPLPPMPEADVSDMEGFLEYIELMLPVVGFSFLKPKPSVNRSAGTELDDDELSPTFEFSSGDAKATAKELNGEFVVLKGSTATLQPRQSWTSYRDLRGQLVEDKKLVEVPDQGLLLFADDVYLTSPSAGAAIVAAGNTNGRTAWKTVGTRQTYADWHQSQLPDDEAE